MSELDYVRTGAFDFLYYEYPKNATDVERGSDLVEGKHEPLAADGSIQVPLTLTPREATINALECAAIAKRTDDYKDRVEALGLTHSDCNACDNRAGCSFQVALCEESFGDCLPFISVCCTSKYMEAFDKAKAHLQEKMKNVDPSHFTLYEQTSYLFASEL